MWQDDDDATAALLRAWFAQPSPPARTLADLSTNAVLLDAAGNQRPINLPTPYAPTVMVPVPVPLHRLVSFDPLPTHQPMLVTVFRLSSVVDGKAIYRQIS
jgi:hypothetical protein